MTVIRYFTAVVATVLLALPAIAGETDHFKGQPANTLEQAVANISEYNNQLETLLTSELSPEVLAQIHILTYTLENALEKLDDSIDQLEDTLEKVHKASEHANPERVKEKGSEYLKLSRTVIK